MDEALIKSAPDSNGIWKEPASLIGKLVSLCWLISEMPVCMKTLHSTPVNVSFSILRPSNGELREKLSSFQATLKFTYNRAVKTPIN